MLDHVKNRADWNEKSIGAKGFTLIELLIVIIILGILAGVAIFAIGGITDKADENACQNEKDTVATAAEAYKLVTGDYPANAAAMTGTDANDQLKSAPKYWDFDGTKVVAKNLEDFPANCS